MLLRTALLAGLFSVLILAAAPPAAPAFSGQVFPNQDKSLSQLTQQALDRQLRATVTGKQSPMATNPANMPYHSFVLPSQRIKLGPPLRMWRMTDAFPSLGPVARNQSPLFCAIPLLEAKAPAATDSMAKSAGKTTFDRIGKRYPIPACKN